MQCNKDKCICYNTAFEDNCEVIAEKAKACIEQGHKDYRETLEG